MGFVPMWHAADPRTEVGSEVTSPPNSASNKANIPDGPEVSAWLGTTDSSAGS